MEHITDEMVVLLDESATVIGSADKRLIHHTSTPLHLAFSCYLFDEARNVLVTRRALSKATWPGTWTNSFCGHPAPGEPIEDAVRRRGRQELGVDIQDLRLVDPHFRYRATDSGGIVEYEVCPVYQATASGVVSPNPDEVMDWVWTDPTALTLATTLAPFGFSPWMVLQLGSPGWAASREAADATLDSSGSYGR
ncbi:MAG: isopentenyl-diphosphate Delta-isomerase [Schumannella sp.]